MTYYKRGKILSPFFCNFAADKMVRKFSVSAVILLFLLTVAGRQYLLYKAYRWHLRNQASAALSNMAREEAERIAFSKSEFSHGLPFIKVPDKSDEIVFRGEFYDVKNVELTSDSVILFAYCDSDEKHLVAEFMKSAKDDSNDPLEDIIELFSEIQLFFPDNQLKASCSCPSVVLLQDFYGRHMQFVFLSIESPPPQNLV